MEHFFFRHARAARAASLATQVETITGGMPARGNGGGGTRRLGPTTGIARSRNSEYNLLRAQREKPMSLARQRTAASPEVSSGYQVIIRNGEAEAPPARLRNNSSGITNAEAKEMTNQGMI